MYFPPPAGLLKGHFSMTWPSYSKVQPKLFFLPDPSFVPLLFFVCFLYTTFHFLPCYITYLYIVYLLFILCPPLLECKFNMGISSVHCILVSLQVPSTPNLLSWLWLALILLLPDSSWSTLVYPTHFSDWYNSFCNSLFLMCLVVEKIISHWASTSNSAITQWWPWEITQPL